MNPNHITSKVIAAAMKVHRKLGPGLLESAYESCMEYELKAAGFAVERQKAVPLATRLRSGKARLWLPR